MAQDLKPFGVGSFNDGDLTIPVDDIRGIHKTPIDLAGQGGAGETGADRLGDLGHGHRLRKFLAAPVGEGDCGHEAI